MLLQGIQAAVPCGSPTARTPSSVRNQPSLRAVGVGDRRRHPGVLDHDRRQLALGDWARPGSRSACRRAAGTSPVGRDRPSPPWPAEVEREPAQPLPGDQGDAGVGADPAAAAGRRCRRRSLDVVGAAAGVGEERFRVRRPGPRKPPAASPSEQRRIKLFEQRAQGPHPTMRLGWPGERRPFLPPLQGRECRPRHAADRLWPRREGGRAAARDRERRARGGRGDPRRPQGPEEAALAAAPAPRRAAEGGLRQGSQALPRGRPAAFPAARRRGEAGHAASSGRG